MEIQKKLFQQMRQTIIIQIIKIYMNYNPHYHAINFKKFILKDFFLIAYILVFMI